MSYFHGRAFIDIHAGSQRATVIIMLAFLYQNLPRHFWIKVQISEFHGWEVFHSQDTQRLPSMVLFGSPDVELTKPSEASAVLQARLLHPEICQEKFPGDVKEGKLVKIRMTKI